MLRHTHPARLGLCILFLLFFILETLRRLLDLVQAYRRRGSGCLIHIDHRLIQVGGFVGDTDFPGAARRPVTRKSSICHSRAGENPNLSIQKSVRRKGFLNFTFQIVACVGGAAEKGTSNMNPRPTSWID